MFSDASDLQTDVMCENPVCNCLMVGALMGATYCSDYCRDAETDIERESCGCGHPACDAGQ